MSAHPPIKWEEKAIATVGGVGIFLAIIGGALLSLGTAEKDTANLLIYVGFAGIAMAIVTWLIVLQPWKEFDDLKEGYFTGHHHDEHEAHDEHAPDEHSSEYAHVETPAASALSTEVAPKALTTAPEAVTLVKAAEPILTPPPVKEAEPAAKAVPVAPPSAKAEAKAPAEKKSDNLEIIEGIGPKSKAALNASGITTFAQVAETSPAELERIIKVEHKVRLVGNATYWPYQAKLAMRGDLSALEDFKSRLKGGALYDDLAQVHGIGPDAQEVLYKAGITSYIDLAAASSEQLRTLLVEAGMSHLNPETWSKQAQFVLDGDLSGLKAFQDQL